MSLNVAKAASTISWSNPADIVYGTALGASQLNATANVAGTFSYSPAAGTVLGAGSQTLSVTFTPDDAANYNGSSANVTLNVTKAATTVSWSNPAGIVYGTALGALAVERDRERRRHVQLLAGRGHGARRRYANLVRDVHARLMRRTTRRDGERVDRGREGGTGRDHVGESRRHHLRDARCRARSSTRPRTSAGSFALLAGRRNRARTPGTQTLSVTFTPADAPNYTTADAVGVDRDRAGWH